MKINLSKSLAMQERAKNRIPGMTQLLSKRPDMFSTGVWPGYYRKAKGIEIEDLDGNTYLDMSISGIGANILGYADEDVDAAVHKAIEMGSSSSLNCAEEIELADLLCELHPWAEQARFARTGGESMAVAVRIARAHTGRDKIAFCGYHGWHDWYLAANIGTENALGEHLIAGLSPNGVPKGLANTAFPFRYNELGEFEEIIRKHGNEIGAIVMEPIRHDAPHPDFFPTIVKLKEKIGAVLIIDEVSAGFRLFPGGAHMTLGVEPDIAVFSKALGNGYPMGAIIGRKSVMEAAQSTFISSTNWTERIGPTAALAMITKYRKHNVHKHLINFGTEVQNGWRKLGAKHGLKLEASGIPPLGHFVFGYENALSLKALFVQLMLEKGFLATNMVYVMYAHQDAHLQKYLEAVDKTFGEIAELIASNKVSESLKGKPSGSGFKRII